MGIAIETRCLDCVYSEYPYVGRGKTSRYFVVDEHSRENVVDNKGWGYRTYYNAYFAYLWRSKGPIQIRLKKLEQYAIYEWSQKHKMFIDRLDSIALYYKEEGKELTPKHIQILFSTQKETCPTTEEKFIKAYEHNFYKKEVRARREKQQKRIEVLEKINFPKRIKVYIDKKVQTSEKAQNVNRITMAIFKFVQQKLHDKLKDYEERPMDNSYEERKRLAKAKVKTTGREISGKHEWYIVEKDENISPIYDTFGQSGPDGVDRYMERSMIDGPAYSIPYSSTDIVLRKAQREARKARTAQYAAEQSAQEKLALNTEQVYTSVTNINPDGDNTDNTNLHNNTVQEENGQPQRRKTKSIPVNTDGWTGQYEESTLREQNLKKARQVKITRSVDEQLDEDIVFSMGGKKSKDGTNNRPDSKTKTAPDKNQDGVNAPQNTDATKNHRNIEINKKDGPTAQKTSLKDKLKAKFVFGENDNDIENDEDAEEYDYYDEGEEYDIPTVGEVLSQLKSSIASFFKSVSDEANRQKQEEHNKKEEKRQKREARIELKKYQEVKSEEEITDDDLNISISF